MPEQAPKPELEKIVYPDLCPTLREKALDQTELENLTRKMIEEEKQRSKENRVRFFIF